MDRKLFAVTLSAALRTIGVKYISESGPTLQKCVTAAENKAKALKIKVKTGNGPYFLQALHEYGLVRSAAGQLELTFGSSGCAEVYIHEVAPGIDSEKMREIARAFVHKLEGRR